MRSGEPKKGGGGGMFTWGRVGDSANYEDLKEDPNDPNYESEPSIEYHDLSQSSNPTPVKPQIQPHAHPVTLNADFWLFDVMQLKAETRSRTDEVFLQGTYSGFVAWLRAICRSKLHSHIFARTVQVTLDKAETDYEIAWGLLDLLHTAKLFTPREIRRGFDRIYQNINETMKDAPNAPEIVLELLSRVVEAGAIGSTCVLRAPQRVYNLGRGSFVLRNIKYGELVIADLIETIAETKEKIIELLKEYFASGVSEGVIDFIKPNKMYGSLVVRKSVELALDRNGREKELCSRLIAEISGYCSPETIVEGFDDILWNSGELVIDVPEAAGIISKFLARAVVDDCLPSNYIVESEIMNDENLEISILLDAFNMLKLKEAYTSLESVWGPQANTIEDYKALFKAIIQEFFDSRDIANAEACVKELGCKHYMHEFVKKIIETVMDKGPSEELIVVELIKGLESKGIIFLDQVTTGVHRVELNLPQLILDVPKAPEILSRIRALLGR